MYNNNNGLPQVEVLRVTRGRYVNYNYLIHCPVTKQAVVVDPAWQMDVLARAVAMHELTLAGVLLTHAHHDHTDLADEVGAHYDCPVWMSQSEIDHSGFNATNLQGFALKPWQVGNLTIRPIHTPGHTPGSICYLIGDNLFTGDVLFAEGCGLCFDLEGAFAMYESLERLKKTLKPQTKIYPGHSYGKPPGQVLSRVRKDNLYLQFPNKDSFAAFRLRAKQKQFVET